MFRDVLDDFVWLWKNAEWWAKIFLCPFISLFFIFFIFPVTLFFSLIEKGWNEK